MKRSQSTTKSAAKASRKPKAITQESPAKKGISWSLLDAIAGGTDSDRRLETTPGWLENTPDPYVSYELSLYADGEAVQRIEVIRTEFISLKEHLATLRGLKLRKTAA